MRQNPNTRRSRGRGGRKPGNSRNQVFDSNGPGARVRGNSAQIYEKYQQLARDATSAGDRVAAENYYQHAEHYFRLLEVADPSRNGNAQEDSQQRNDNRAQNVNAAQNNGAAQNDGTAQVDGVAQVDGAAQNEGSAQPDEAVVVPQAVSEPQADPAELVSEHAPESVAALIEAVEQGNAEKQDQASNGSGSGESSAKPARRTRSRRPNGSANAQNTSEKDAEAAPSEEESDPRNEDSNPAGA